ncbi:fatty acid-binding protein DegV [Lentilactobacillus curieae]|uniref:Fatty acid-binding protein DegV n=1 Tax=Lentilactobacillus curieae TaxID=1138822 RepID=A0A1S6QIV1_9LACO|nr:DegV family protein [Lentilactobacillus curieae]AQW21547.1 fatty acid-binding protein DegV [Lentilactobacillus curieae]
MQPKIGLLVDSAFDIPAEIAANTNVDIVPLIVTVNGEEYLDRETIDTNEVYRFMDKDVIPKTASPTIELVIKSIERLKSRGFTEIVAVTISGGLSVTNQVFKQAAEQYSDLKISVIDTKNIGIGSGLIATYAEDLILEGVGFEDIVKRVNHSVANSRVYFYVPTLKFLRLGGRIGRVAGLVGSALKIKPIISCNEDGIYYPIAKARSESKAISKLIDLAVEHSKTAAHARVAVVQGNDDALMKKVTAMMQEKLPKQNIYNGDVSPALGVHTGSGLIGIAVQID